MGGRVSSPPSPAPFPRVYPDRPTDVLRSLAAPAEHEPCRRRAACIGTLFSFDDEGGGSSSRSLASTPCPTQPPFRPFPSKLPIRPEKSLVEPQSRHVRSRQNPLCSPLSRQLYPRPIRLATPYPASILCRRTGALQAPELSVPEAEDETFVSRAGFDGDWVLWVPLFITVFHASSGSTSRTSPRGRRVQECR